VFGLFHNPFPFEVYETGTPAKAAENVPKNKKPMTIVDSKYIFNDLQLKLLYIKDYFSLIFIVKYHH
jgi:hypothetical protein